MTRRPGPAPALMIVGTCSDAGKSTLVAALCRIFARRGLAVAPFKAQNMSLNAGVTAEGHEIGRSTCVQAEAAGIPPHVDMNPVLLKPEAEKRSQVILEGRPHSHLLSKDWHARRDVFWRAITASLDRLRQRVDLVIIEGAGSPAEINLAHSDVTNLRVAVYAGAPALLVGDIDRGGVFASLLGTVLLLEDDQRETVKGFVINRMRGDVGLLADGPAELEKRAGGIPTLGVIPWLSDIGLAEEDRLIPPESPEGPCEVDVAVIRFPRLSNFDDFDPLVSEPGVRVRLVSSPRELTTPEGAPTDAVILPGTKMTLADLAWLRRVGLADALVELAGTGVQIVGVCGGFQMLGADIVDQEGAEAEAGSREPGLGLLPTVTHFSRHKHTRLRKAEVIGGGGPLGELEGADVKGYEIHMGTTRWPHSEGGGAPDAGRRRAVLRWTDDNAPAPDDQASALDGASDEAGHVWGVYLHGLFDADDFRHRWLRGLGRRGPGRRFDRGAAYDRLADHVERHLDMDAIEHLLWPEC
ncbi:MAG: cobyric acid synthase [Acidobacteriota bacterium]